MKEEIVKKKIDTQAKDTKAIKDTKVKNPIKANVLRVLKDDS